MAMWLPSLLARFGRSKTGLFTLTTGLLTQTIDLFTTTNGWFTLTTLTTCLLKH